MGKHTEKHGGGLAPAIGGVLISAKTGIPIAMGGALHTADVVAEAEGGLSAEAKEIASQLEEEAAQAIEAGEDPMPGFVDKCMARVQGKVDDPGAVCAALKDKITGTTHWRGKR